MDELRATAGSTVDSGGSQEQNPPSPEVDLSSIMCPVCASPLTGTVEVCTRCQTPQHSDCVRFIGRCSRFGCGACEFITLEAADAGTRMTDVTIDNVTDSIPIVRPRPRRRGVVARMMAGMGLLAANPTISLPILILSIIICSVPSGLLAGLGAVLVQSLLVILFTARARGKEPTMVAALRLANERGARVLLSGFAAQIVIMIPIVIGVILFGVAGSVSMIPALILRALGLTMFLAALERQVSYSLVPIVAAMGREEEPEGPLGRSSSLVRPFRRDALVAQALNAVLIVGPGIALPLVLQVPFVSLALMGTTVYWLLLYLEARRHHERDFLPHAPDRYLPPAEPHDPAT